MIPAYVAAASADVDDSAAWSELYTRHRKCVYGLCHRILNDVDAAEDMTQEVFLHLVTRLSQFRGDSLFSTWLYRVARNVCLMKVRGPAAEFRRSLARLDEATADGKDEMSRKARTWGERDGALEWADDRKLLATALSRLAPGFRKMFTLKDVYGYEHHEIAQLMGKTIGDSKSQTHKARVRMKKLLRQGGVNLTKRRGR